MKKFLILISLLVFPVALYVLFPTIYNVFQISQASAFGNFQVTVNIEQPATLKPVSKNIWGVNLETVYKDKAELYSKFDPNKMKQLGVKYIRFMAGCTGTIYDWKNSRIYYLDQSGTVVKQNVMSLDDALSIANDLGAELLYEVNVNVNKHTECGWTPLFQPSVDDAVQLVTQYKGKIKYFDLGNEPYFANGWSVDEYAQTAVSFAQALKQIDPTIKLGIESFQATGRATDPWIDPKDTDWTNGIKKVLNSKCTSAQNVDCFDFVSIHQYALSGFDPNKPESLASGNFKGNSAYYPLANYSWIFSKRVGDFSPKNLAITEWNLQCWSPVVQSIFTAEHGFFTLETLLQMADKNVSAGNFFTMIFGSQKDCGLSYKNASGQLDLNTAAQAFSLSSVLAGGQLLDTTVVSPTLSIPNIPGCGWANCLYGNVSLPYVSSYAGFGPDGLLYAFLVNRHQTQAANVTVNSNSVQMLNQNGTADVLSLTASDYTDTSFTQNIYSISTKPNFTVSVPPVSIVRLKIASPFAPVINSFTASPGSITAGSSSTLSWSVSNATSISIDQGIGSVTGLTSKSVSPTQTTTYTLTVANASGSVTAQATVNVGGASLLGDLNGDHIVNSLDWSIMNQHWLTSDPVVDLNHDGIVNSIDFSILNANWFKSG